MKTRSDVYKAVPAKQAYLVTKNKLKFKTCFQDSLVREVRTHKQVSYPTFRQVEGSGVGNKYSKIANKRKIEAEM